MERKDPEFEQMSLSELAALEAGVIPISPASHEENPKEAQQRSRAVKREIGVH